MDPERRRSRDLSPRGPLGTIDRAVDLALAGGARVWGPSLAGGALLAFAVLLVYYLERIEGVTSMRLPLALGVVLAWWGRAYLLGLASRRVAGSLWDAEATGAGSPGSVARTASVVGLGLWVWACLLAVGTMGGVVGVLVVYPFLALRGAVAPSWIARAACAPRAGWAGFADAVRDAHGRRIEGVLTEGMILAGALGLAVNLYAAAFAAMMLMRSFGGLELASIETFLSASNTFVMLAVGALALVLLEPLRAAHSASAYVEARVRAEGLDLRVGLDDAIRHARGRARRRSAARAAVALLAALTVLPSTTEAQPDVPPPPTFEEPAPVTLPHPPDPHPPDIVVPPDPARDAITPPFALEVDPVDREVQHDVEQILARDEFREFADHRGDGVRQLIERLFEWLFRSRDEAPRIDPSRIPRLPLPGAWVFLVIGALLLLAVGVYVAVTYGRGKRKARDAEGPAADRADPRERAPRSFLDEAAALAESGELRAALRALYLATLVALDRRRWIAFDPHLTNWQYLRQMPRGQVRDRFRELTRLFDYKWYGEEPTTTDDYQRCRELAAQIVDEGAS